MKQPTSLSFSTKEKFRELCDEDLNSLSDKIERYSLGELLLFLRVLFHHVKAHRRSFYQVQCCREYASQLDTFAEILAHVEVRLYYAVLRPYASTSSCVARLLKVYALCVRAADAGRQQLRAQYGD